MIAAAQNHDSVRRKYPTQLSTKDVRLYHHQAKAFLSRRRFVGLIGGTGGGKTFFGPIWLYQEIAKYPEDEFFVVAPTYKILMRQTLPMMISLFRGTDAEGTLNQSKGYYRLPQGGMIWLGSADRPESLEAGQYRAAWLDEAGQMPFLAWVVMQARLGFKLGRALLTTTPYGMNWLYKEFYIRWRDGDKDYDVIQFESVDNPDYPVSEFERARRTLSAALFQMRYRGLFKKLEGLVYPDFSQANICDPFKIPESWRKLGGIDFGFNNPFVSLKAAISLDDVMYIYQEYYKARTLLKDHAEEVRDIENVADPEDAQSIAELKDLGVKVKKADNTVDLGIQRVTARVREKRLIAFKTCRYTLDEFDTYHYKEGTDKPIKENDHCVSTIRYIVNEIDKEIDLGSVFTAKSVEEKKAKAREIPGPEPAKKEKALPKPKRRGKLGLRIKPRPKPRAKPRPGPRPAKGPPTEILQVVPPPKIQEPSDDEGDAFYG